MIPKFFTKLLLLYIYDQKNFLENKRHVLTPDFFQVNENVKKKEDLLRNNDLLRKECEQLTTL